MVALNLIDQCVCGGGDTILTISIEGIKYYREMITQVTEEWRNQRRDGELYQRLETLGSP